MNKLFSIVFTLMIISFGYSQCQGDITDDGDINVLDIIVIVNHILGNTLIEEENVHIVDLNNDQMINVRALNST